MFKIRIDYLTKQEEIEIVRSTTASATSSCSRC